MEMCCHNPPYGAFIIACCFDYNITIWDAERQDSSCQYMDYPTTLHTAADHRELNGYKSKSCSAVWGCNDETVSSVHRALLRRHKLKCKCH